MILPTSAPPLYAICDSALGCLFLGTTNLVEGQKMRNSRWFDDLVAALCVIVLATVSVALIVVVVLLASGRL